MNITITEQAAIEGAKLLETLKEDDNTIVGVNIGIKGGGCAGFQYIIQPISESETESHFLFEKEEFKIYIDPISMEYLKDSTIDWETNIQGSSMIIKNPNSNSTCGCGSSFN